MTFGTFGAFGGFSFASGSGPGGATIAISPPALTVTDWAVYPPELTVALDETVFEGDILQVQADNDPRFTSTSIDEQVTLDATAISTGAITIPGLSSISSPAVTYFRARVKRSPINSAWSDVEIHGELPDDLPASFSFTDVTEATLSTVYESNTITLSDFNVPVAMSIIGGEYAVDSGSGFGAYTSAAGLAYPGDDIKVRLNSSGSEETATTAVLAVGILSDTYTVTTGDFTAPVLTNPTDASAGSTTMTGSVITDEDNGTLEYFSDTSATTPADDSEFDARFASAPASNSQAVTAIGVQDVSLSGLSPSTGYYTHFRHTDASGNKSEIETADGFTTAAPSAPSFDARFAGTGVNVNYTSTSYTYTGMDIGAAASNRHVVVFATMFNGSGNGLSAVTIGGVSATRIANSGTYDIWIAAVPTGTTANIVVTAASAIGVVRIGVGALYGANPTPASTSSLPFAFNSAPQSVSVTTPTNGITLIAGFVGSVPPAQGTWSNTYASTAALVSSDDRLHLTYRTASGTATASVTGWGNINSAILTASFDPA